MIKKHLEGGTLKEVMVQEVKRVLNKYQDDPAKILRAALELGTTPKSVRQWMGPVEKGGWAELQPDIRGSVEKVLTISKKKPKNGRKASKKSQARA